MALPVEERAQINLSWLQNNVYPGRGIVAGLDETGKYLVQVYWIMGRRESSRNRILKSDDLDYLYTEEAKPTTKKGEDAPLLFYNAMRKIEQHYIVSNGDQTDTIVEAHRELPHLSVILASRTYEPDENFTQRITAVSSLEEGSLCRIRMSILRKSVFGTDCDRLSYEYVPHVGFGHCITTYSGDGDPLPAFVGDPMLMPIRGEIGTVVKTYWNALNIENRVSLAVKFIEVSNGRSRMRIVNKYETS